MIQVLLETTLPNPNKRVMQSIVCPNYIMAPIEHAHLCMDYNKPKILDSVINSSFVTASASNQISVKLLIIVRIKLI